MWRVGPIAGGLLFALALAAFTSQWLPALDVVAEAAPVALAASVFSLLLASTASADVRAPALAAPVLACLAWGLVMAPGFEHPPQIEPAAGSSRLRIIQINLGGSGLLQPDRAAAWLADQRPDVIFVDDVDPSLRTALQRRGFHWRQGAAWTGLATRAPNFRPAYGFTASDWSIMPDVARARLVLESGPVELLGVHLVRPLGATAAEARAGQGSLVELARRYGGCSLIVAGDLNLVSWSYALRSLVESAGVLRLDGVEPTWPARAPAGLAFLPIDHVLTTPDWRAVRVWRGADIGATHYPLVADLVRMPGAGLRASSCPGKPTPDNGRPE